MKTFMDLTEDIQEVSLYQQLQALRDGSFLADYDVTEKQVTELYNDIEEIIEMKNKRKTK